jgi:tripartite-type tricarboxylate transporter receptor subunit TctC
MKLSLLKRVATLAAIACMALPAIAQDTYPSKPVRLVIPQSAGGASDVLGRLYADYLAKALNQTVVVDNKPGANGVLASSFVAKQPADGYTIMIAGISYLAFNPLTYKALPYNPEKDFDGVALLTNTPFLLLSNPATNIKTLADLQKAAKANPGALNFASAGKGNSTHLIMEMLAQRLDVKLTHVPYNGTAPGMTSVIGGQTQLMADVLATGAVQAKAGKVQPIAVVGSRRAPTLPDVPTIAELGIKDFPLPGWYAVVAPAGTPRAVLERLNAETQKFLEDPQARARLDALALEPLASKPETVKEWMRRDAKAWSPLLQQLGISND